jgi:uncharacterized Tic20 family protein
MNDPQTPPPDPGPDPVNPSPEPVPAIPAAPGPPVPSSRSWEVACHVSALSGWFTGGVGWVLGPLIVWLLKKSEMPGVDAHGKESLNFNISFLIYSLALTAVAIVTCGLGWFIALPLGIALGLAQIILSIVASLKASEGGFYRYPLTMRLVT